MKAKQEIQNGTEIAANIFWIDGGTSNFYLCIESDKLILIDTGTPRREQRVWDLIDELGHRKEDLAAILVTHADIDHVGSLAVIQQATGAQVYAGAETAVHVTKGSIPKHLSWWMEIASRWVMRRRTLTSSAIIKSFSDGETLPFLGGLRVLATPGHTPDHHSFYSPTTGILFAGDALKTENGRICTSPQRITADQEAANKSAMRLLELAPAIIACGHGPPLSTHDISTLMVLFNELRQQGENQ